MKLILQTDVKNLGKAGDQVFVKKGYARNFLIPRGQALPINKDRLKIWKHQKVIIEAKKRKALTERKLLIEKLSSLKLEFEKESQKDGRLFGSVTAHEISQKLEKEHKISVDKRDISVTALKTAGEQNVTISLDSKHKTKLFINIKGKVIKKAEDRPLTKADSQTKAIDNSAKKSGEELSHLDKSEGLIIDKSKNEETISSTTPLKSEEASEKSTPSAKASGSGDELKAQKANPSVKISQASANQATDLKNKTALSPTKSKVLDKTIKPKQSDGFKKVKQICLKNLKRIKNPQQLQV